MTPRPDHSLTELEADVDSLLAAVRRTGPTADEIDRAKASLQLAFLGGLESNLGKALRLADRSGVPQRSESRLRGGLREVPGRDRGRREARREHLPRQGTRGAQHRARRQEGSGVEGRGKHHGDPERTNDESEQLGGQMIAQSIRARCALGAIAAAGVLVPTTAFAQQTSPAAAALDRSAVPTAGKTPELHVPTWTKLTLTNGAQLDRVGTSWSAARVDERRVRWRREPVRASGQDRPRHIHGLRCSSRARRTRTGDQLAEAMQSLGSNINASVGAESGSMSLFVMRDKFEPMLALFEDVLVNPSFPQAALDRLRARTVVNLQQAKDRTGSIAGVVFPKMLYTADQPYGRSMTEQSVKAITRDDLVAFHQQYYQPGRAVITVVGDVKPDDVKRALDKALAPWKPGGSEPAFTYPAPPAPKATTIFLVDKPSARAIDLRDR